MPRDRATRNGPEGCRRRRHQKIPCSQLAPADSAKPEEAKKSAGASDGSGLAMNTVKETSQKPYERSEDRVHALFMFSIGFCVVSSIFFSQGPPIT